jgi:sulfur dioxygenase
LISALSGRRRFPVDFKVHDVEDYAALMASLRLPDPKMMDVAVPANMRQGLHQEEVARRGWAYSTDEAKGLVGRWVALIDLREKAERDRAGTIPGSVHAPYADLQDNIDDGGLIHELAMTGKMIVFYCAFGERSAMAVQAAPDSPPPRTLRAAWRRG